MTTDFHEAARGLRNAVEPVAAGVYCAAGRMRRAPCSSSPAARSPSPGVPVRVFPARVSRLVPEAGRGRLETSAAARSSVPG
jgi:hypothetical protein